ncbi:hypothetical protein JZ751_002404 [Albula glossodonta]|uniref:Uncharacterized protein n=1 Tax=Albula glossodonta TaxID=121402 RepID=A0A8T2MUL0_9TELE|nr:hypothetical protein JZ751_002404 [Albula glossodonta]
MEIFVVRVSQFSRADTVRCVKSCQPNDITCILDPIQSFSHTGESLTQSQSDRGFDRQVGPDLGLTSARLPPTPSITVWVAGSHRSHVWAHGAARWGVCVNRPHRSAGSSGWFQPIKPLSETHTAEQRPSHSAHSYAGGRSGWWTTPLCWSPFRCNQRRSAPALRTQNTESLTFHKQMNWSQP